MAVKLMCVMMMCLLATTLARPEKLQPSTAYGPPAPPPPTYGPPVQLYGPPEDSYEAPEPSYEPPKPVYRAPKPSYKAPEPKKGMPFVFSYDVQDQYSGNNFAHNADSDGTIVTGEYRVDLPDGRTQIVSYKADIHSGYVAEVRYEGEAEYPEQEPYRPPPTPSYQPPEQSYGPPPSLYGPPEE